MRLIRDLAALDQFLPSLNCASAEMPASRNQQRRNVEMQSSVWEACFSCGGERRNFTSTENSGVRVDCSQCGASLYMLHKNGDLKELPQHIPYEMPPDEDRTIKYAARSSSPQRPGGVPAEVITTRIKRQLNSCVARRAAMSLQRLRDVRAGTGFGLSFKTTALPASGAAIAAALLFAIFGPGERPLPTAERTEAMEFAEIESGSGATALPEHYASIGWRTSRYAYLAERDALRLRLAALADPEANAAAEASLELSRPKRREIQRRLSLAKHDPLGADGIFGAATRKAIISWQETSGVPPTGYLTARTIEMLVSETDDAYRAWRIAERSRQERLERVVSVAPVPRPTRETPECERLVTGEIAYGHNVRCDVRGLRENLGAMGGRLTELFSRTERAQTRTSASTVWRQNRGGA